MSVSARLASVDDLPEIHRLLRLFGAHGGNSTWVTSTPESLGALLFDGTQRCFAHVVDRGGAVVGIALWFLNYNFGSGRPGLYLEDLFIEEPARSSGAGRVLMQALAAEAVARGCARMDWLVLTANERGKRFYASVGAHHSDEWEPWRLDEDALMALAAS